MDVSIYQFDEENIPILRIESKSADIKNSTWILHGVRLYKKDENNLAALKCLNPTDDDYANVCNQWSDGIFKIFNSFPRFDWE